MKKIVAIGGGEIGRPGYPIETTKIDKEIIKLSGKSRPKLLFIPTASSDSEVYIKAVEKHFGKRLGCKVDSLSLLNKRLTEKTINNQVFASDIIYVGGGNTLKMMRVWRKIGLDKILEKAWEKGIVLSGLSAGAICWFKFGVSDSKKFNDPKASLIKLKGLDFISALYCPHYDVEKDREPALKITMRETSGIALAFDNCCAIEIIGDKYRIINSKTKAKAYKVYWKREKYHREEIQKKKKLTSLKELLSK